MKIVCYCLFFPTVNTCICLTLCDAMNCSPPGSTILGILQARTLEWIVMPFSRVFSQPRDRIFIFYISCIDRWDLNHYCLGSPWIAFDIIRNCQMVLHQGCMILCSHQQIMRVPIALQPLSSLMFSLFLTLYAQKLSRVWRFVTPWAVACQAPWSMGFSWKKYWSGLPFPSLGVLSYLEIKPRCPALQEDYVPLIHHRNHIFNAGHSNRYAVVCQCGFILHYHDDWWYQISFNVLICLAYILFHSESEK